jgi:hypothetical protein
MLSPTQPAPGKPTALLTRDDRYDPINSEWHDNTQAKLVEAPYIAELGGKDALITSTGTYYLQPDCEAGVAWSDTLMPAPGQALSEGAADRRAGRLGTARPPRGPLSPSVAASRLAQLHGQPSDQPGRGVGRPGPGGAWRLSFAGYDPADRPADLDQGPHRRPYFAGIQASVPPGQTVAAAPDADLATRLQPVSQ